MLLEQVQSQLESIYDIGLKERAEDFLIEKKEALSILNVKEETKIPKELLLVRQPVDETVEVALFLDPKLFRNLSAHNLFENISQKSLSDFCIVIEGVSHFVYYLWKSYRKVPITQLELELQAEIDKFVMLFLYLRTAQSGSGFSPSRIFEALFENFTLLDHLSGTQKNRYMTASHLAGKFCYQLHQRFHSHQHLRVLLDEIRHFYNLTQEQKISYIMH